NSISSAVYGGVKGYGSAGRYGSVVSRGVSVRRSMSRRSSSDNSLRYFQLRDSACSWVGQARKRLRHTTPHRTERETVQETVSRRIIRIPFTPYCNVCLAVAFAG